MLKPLPEHSTIGVLAPAFPPDARRLEKGIEYLQNRGHRVVQTKSLTARHGYFSGSDDLRLNDLHQLFADPAVEAIICARGGWGCLRLLNKLDFDLIRKNPKLLVGYSDITTLQLALWHKCALPSLSGPMVAVEMGRGILEFTERHFWQQIYNDDNSYSIALNDPATKIWNPGNGNGTLNGGCLSLVAHQLGTPYMPDLKGNILFLEDVGEAPYKIDRYLAQLQQAGIFDQINGLILGNFLDCEDDNPDRHSFTVEEVLHQYFDGVSFPVVYDFPYGHGMKKISMPVGVQAEMDTEKAELKVGNLFRP